MHEAHSQIDSASSDGNKAQDQLKLEGQGWSCWCDAEIVNPLMLVYTTSTQLENLFLGVDQDKHLWHGRDSAVASWFALV